MSDIRSPGWDRPESDAEADRRPLPLCSYHALVTERLSTFHSNQIAKQAPCCVAETRQTNSL
jgi:hypothetical protein